MGGEGQIYYSRTALYFQWLFETNDYGMTSCPSARAAENEDRFEGLILSELEK